MDFLGQHSEGSTWRCPGSACSMDGGSPVTCLVGVSLDAGPCKALSCSALRGREGGSSLRCESILDVFISKALRCTIKAGEPAAVVSCSPETRWSSCSLSSAGSERDVGCEDLSGREAADKGSPAREAHQPSRKRREHLPS